MQTQLFLIAPPDARTAPLLEGLAQLARSREISALLLPRGARSENAYKDHVKAVAPAAQAAGAAVLIEGEPGLVKMLGADGLHVRAGAAATRDAVKALRPHHIVGVGDLHSRDEAMSMGELEVDYILFGPLSGAIEPAEREMARWWAETMEIPSVLSDPDAGFDAFDAEGCEFIGLALQPLETAQ